MALAAGLALSITACGSVGDKLIVAPNPETAENGVALWAVSPGEEPGDANLIGEDALDALQIFRSNADGEITANLLSQQWNDTLLVGTSGSETSTLNAMDPGGDPTAITTSDNTFESVITQRGVFTFAEGGCQLAKTETRAEQLGTGACRLRSDTNVVAHWPEEGGDLTITDLRTDEPVKVEGTYIDAQLLVTDNLVLGVEQVEESSAARLIDGETGEVLETFEPSEFVGVIPPPRGAKGFVMVTNEGAEQALHWVDADGGSEEIVTASSTLLMPVSVTAEGMHYLSAPTATPGESTLFHWSPGEDPEELMSGNLSAVQTGGEAVVVATSTEEEMSFWKVDTHPIDDDSEPLLEIELEEGLQPTIRNALVKGDTMHLVLGTDVGSYVRLDLKGTDSVQPIEAVPNLNLASIDSGGSAVFISQGAEGTADLLVSPAHHDEADVRANADMFAGSLLHEGKVYFTAQNDGKVAVWSARAQGDSDPELLYEDRMLVGATFEVFGGAREYQVVAPAEGGATGGF